MAVIIDVFRAFTLAPCAFARGVVRILPVATPRDALAWLQDRRPARVSLVCMGWNATERTAEDEACAQYLAAGLRGALPEFGSVRAHLRQDPSGAKFFDPSRPWFSEEDFEACMRVSAYPFVLRRVRDPAGRLSLERVDVPAAASPAPAAL